MAEYVSLQQRRQKWSERRYRQLLAELSRSQAILQIMSLKTVRLSEC